MNLLVLLFFLQNIIVTTLLGYKFFSKKDPIFKNFGIALFLNAAAFAIWSYAIVTKSSDLNFLVTAGAVPFITSLVFLLLSGAQKVSEATRKNLVVGAVIVGAGLFALRTFVYPSAPSISEEGLFFFNLHPIVQMLYALGLGFTAIPAISFVAAKFKGKYAAAIRYGFLLEVIGGILLMTTSNTLMLYVLGWVMGITYFVMCVVLLSNKKAWSVSN